MAYTTINKPTDHFNVALHTGTTDAQSITGVGFQPDFTWIKVRNDTAFSVLQDSVRGPTGTDSYVMTTSAAATDVSDAITSFDSDGFTVGTDSNDRTNYATKTHVSRNWKAATSFSNSAGSNGADLACTGKVNTTAGFSIITATSDSAANKTIAHGLGAVPDVIFAKNLAAGYNWDCYFKTLGYNASLILNEQNSTRTGAWGSSAFTTTTFNTQENYSSTNGQPYIYYCWTSIKGFSKIGKYEGNSNTDGTFIYTGFKPAYFICKPSAATDNWVVFDNKRNNAKNSSTSPYFHYANKNFSETTDTKLIDFVSNGIKIRASGNTVNRSGNFVYMAFAEHPFVSSAGVPTTAR